MRCVPPPRPLQFSSVPLAHFTLPLLCGCFLQTCTDFILLLIELFGENPMPDQLTGVAIGEHSTVGSILVGGGTENITH